MRDHRVETQKLGEAGPIEGETASIDASRARGAAVHVLEGDAHPCEVAKTGIDEGQEVVAEGRRLRGVEIGVVWKKRRAMLLGAFEAALEPLLGRVGEGKKARAHRKPVADGRGLAPRPSRSKPTDRFRGEHLDIGFAIRIEVALRGLHGEVEWSGRVHVEERREELTPRLLRNDLRLDERDDVRNVGEAHPFIKDRSVRRLPSAGRPNELVRRRRLLWLVGHSVEVSSAVTSSCSATDWKVSKRSPVRSASTARTSRGWILPRHTFGPKRWMK